MRSFVMGTSSWGYPVSSVKPQARAANRYSKPSLGLIEALGIGNDLYIYSIHIKRLHFEIEHKELKNNNKNKKNENFSNLIIEKCNQGQG